jgi:hypothetical protein
MYRGNLNPLDSIDGPYAKQVMLEHIKCAVGSKIGAHALSRMKMHEDFDYRGDMIMRLSTEIASEVLTPKYTTQLEVRFEKFFGLEFEFLTDSPSSWWQSFKKKFFPEWVLKLWPVVIETTKHVFHKTVGVKSVREVNMRVVATYPMLEDVSPEIGPVVVHVINDEFHQNAGEYEVEIVDKEIGNKKGEVKCFS